MRQNAHETYQALMAARQDGDIDHAALLVGQDAGLINAVLPAAEVIQQMVAEAHEILTGRLPDLGRATAS